MKNTLNFGKFNILIYKGSDGYTGICYETGSVDVADTLQEVQEHIMNGLIATMQTIKNGNLSEEAINQRPDLKHRFLFFSLPIIATIARPLEISFFTKPISPSLFANA